MARNEETAARLAVPMARIYLIRHARPSTSWGGDDDDPGLDDQGWAQARAAAGALLALPELVRPTQVAASPLRRCRETAAPFAEAIAAEVSIVPAVGEIPTPAGLDPAERGPWLRLAFSGSWRDVEGDLDYEAWRLGVVEAVAARPGAAIFSHFVAINAVVTALQGLERMIVLRPDHASITTLELGDDGLRVVELGREAATQVL
jgi:broad specificity phosphatase PhoE